jgi:thymidine phosphorylase
VQGGVAKTLREGIAKCREHLRNGKALEKFYEMVEAQGGNVEIVKDVKKYHMADHILKVKATEGGFVGGIDALAVGNACVDLGAGRKTVEQNVDFMAGVMLRKKCGDAVEVGETLAEVHTNLGGTEAKAAASRVLAAFTVSSENTFDSSLSSLITNVVTKSSVDPFDAEVLQ